MSKKVMAKRSDNNEWVCGDFCEYIAGEPLVITYDIDKDKMIAHRVQSDTIKDIMASDNQRIKINNKTEF